jgi:hypothetical protein
MQCFLRFYFNLDSLSYTDAKMASFNALKGCSAKQQLMGKVCRKRSQAADAGRSSPLAWALADAWRRDGRLPQPCGPSRILPKLFPAIAAWRIPVRIGSLCPSGARPKRALRALPGAVPMRVPQPQRPVPTHPEGA